MNTTNHKKKKKTKTSFLHLNKKASAYWFIYTLAFAFVLTILYIIFGQVLKIYLYPTTIQLTGGVTTEPDRWLSFWEFTPYIILVIIGLFLFFKLTQKDTTAE